jgi:hypothetical protein
MAARAGCYRRGMTATRPHPSPMHRLRADVPNKEGAVADSTRSGRDFFTLLLLAPRCHPRNPLKG